MARVFYGHLIFALNYARSYLLQNRVIAAPTDTIYGFLGRYHAKPITEIHRLKQRLAPFLVLLPSVSAISAFALVEKWQWDFLYELVPGKNTIVLKKKPELFYPYGESVAVRIPRVEDSLFLTSLLYSVGPLVAPSLNRHGQPPLSDSRDILKNFGTDLAAVFIEPNYQEKAASSLWSFDESNKSLQKVR